MVVEWIGPIVPLLLLVDHLGPICATIKSIVAATGIEQSKKKMLKVDHISKLETVLLTLACKIGEQSLKNGEVISRVNEWCKVYKTWYLNLTRENIIRNVIVELHFLKTSTPSSFSTWGCIHGT